MIGFKKERTIFVVDSRMIVFCFIPKLKFYRQPVDQRDQDNEHNLNWMSMFLLPKSSSPPSTVFEGRRDRKAVILGPICIFFRNFYLRFLLPETILFSSRSYLKHG